MAFHEYLAGLWDALIDGLTWLQEEGVRQHGATDPWWMLPVKAANDILDAYNSFDQFAGDWKWMRLAVPLQGRLVMEQLLWDRGLPWRSLITGFRAIEGDVGHGVSGPPLPPTTTIKTNALPTTMRCPDGFYWDAYAATCLPVAGHREYE